MSGSGRIHLELCSQDRVLVHNQGHAAHAARTWQCLVTLPLWIMMKAVPVPQLMQGTWSRPLDCQRKTVQDLSRLLELLI
jgi:hypothetical protein